MVYLLTVTSTALSRSIAVALATLVTFGLVLLREATSPSGEGYWTAIAAAPAGDLYVADEGGRELRLVLHGGGYRRLGPLPRGIIRALAADGANLLLATEGYLYVSNDTGASWRRALSGRFTAVSLDGASALAGAWADGLFRSDDGGSHWSRAAIPAGDSEFEVIVPGFAATLLGLLETRDGGGSWSRVPGIPDRVTALSLTSGGLVRIGDWRGQVLDYNPATRSVSQVATFSGGVLAVTGSVVGTTNGVYPDNGGPLHRREVTRIALSQDFYWAATARGPIYLSGDGHAWRLAYHR